MILIKELANQPKEVTIATKNKLNLSDDEDRVYDLALKEKSIIEIADSLMVSSSTVSRRLKSIRIKLSNITHS